MAFVLALAAALVVLFAPLWSWEDSTGASGRSSLFADLRAGDEDAAPLVFLALAVLLPLLALLALGTRLDAAARWIAAALLLVLCLLGAMSIGMFFLPAAVALLVAAIVGPERELDERSAPAGSG